MKNWQSLLWLGFGATTAIILSSTLYCYRSKQCCNAKAKQRKRVRRRPRVVFFGDSITERGWDVDYSGWLANLGHWWSRRLDVVNRGLSGYNTTWSRQIIDQWILDEPIDFLFLFFGENDGVTVTSSQQHVPLEEYRDNLHFIISRVRMVSSRAFNMAISHVVVLKITTDLSQNTNSSDYTFADMGKWTQV